MFGKYIFLISCSIYFASGEIIDTLNLESQNEKGYTIYQPIYISPILHPQHVQRESTSIEKPTDEKLEEILNRWKIRVVYQLSTIETNITENINYNISVKINSLEKTIRDQFEKLNEVIANKSFGPHKLCEATEVKPHVQPGYQTAYACEWKTLELACERGTVINVIWANYGRLGLSKCNDNGNQNWDTNCKTSDSILNDRCHMKRTCSVSASNALFGDPCAGTEKYIEVHYQCLPVHDY